LFGQYARREPNNEVSKGEKAVSESTARIPLVEPSDFTPEQRELAKPDTGRQDLNITRAMVNHPSLYAKWMAFSEELVFNSQLPLRDREILTFKTVTACKGVYPTAHHNRITRQLGFSEAEIAAIEGDGEGLSRFEQALVRAAAELVGDHNISRPTWDMLAERYSKTQMMEVVFLVGNYAITASATNSFGVPVETDQEEIWSPYPTK
jgi:4-carboxymuconolactone decarboxylase